MGAAHVGSQGGPDEPATVAVLLRAQVDGAWPAVLRNAEDDAARP